MIITCVVMIILSLVQSNKIAQAQANIKASKEAIKASNTQFNEFIKGGF